ncbi:MAG: GGDEF domain-containing protein [Alteromonadaceae bacterium]|uniref:GGDEF domain-containing protein n=1 Tax=unclassified Marinobacter TaxID=83889 RepID=UPI000C5E2C04|nr:GGDEF domain-containing protein [Marinobacter sp. BGYM27]MAA64642.1 GGDEF domain-containing protein [Alteromonadaceae bacterium]MBH84654.1 GGDEF domain-containing protein [Alteromonadaceae bacterium]MDG5498147.1 GGDEF domain-containing protein [Marinobacter sp. BGYM27]|tara:strand:+ start:50414 stop:51412 length:999 start_codon:yes stop_codon:yes gene_type:complete
MTETRLRTLTHCAAYLITAIFMFTLAIQNLRYGFYDLFYLATTLGALAVSGIVYTIVMRRQQLSAPGHSILLTIMNLMTAYAVFSCAHPNVSHWALALLLLNFLVLPLRTAIVLSLALLTLTGLHLLTTLPITEAVVILTGMVMLFATAAVYSWRYTHMAQSAEDLAITDPATGAHNARFLDETLQKEISRARATGNTLSVIHLHLDHLDQAHDLHGKGQTRVLMQEITKALFDVVRAGDTLYSINDGDFFLILPFTPEEGVRVSAERIRRMLGESVWPVVGRLTATLGCTTWHIRDTASHHLRDRCTQAIEEAQRRGTDKAWFIGGEAETV